MAEGDNGDKVKDQLPQPEQPVVLTLELFPTTGALRMSGPIAQKVLCYGMLELAKEAIANNKGPAIITPKGSFLQGIRNMGKKN